VNSELVVKKASSCYQVCICK